MEHIVGEVVTILKGSYKGYTGMITSDCGWLYYEVKIIGVLTNRKRELHKIYHKFSLELQNKDN